MGSPTQELFKKFTSFWARLSGYINPIGKFYIQWITLCRTLVIVVFLDDLFKTMPSLECDTKQVGCQMQCQNRFAPISHMQLWRLENFISMFTIFIFIAFNVIQNIAYQKYEKKHGKNNLEGQRKYWLKTKTKVDKSGKEKRTEILKSSYTVSGYILMLGIRFLLEVYCIYLEANLGKHVSQNAKFTDIFNLKERWICPTNAEDVHGLGLDESAQEFQSALAGLNLDIMSFIVPQANRSKLFYREDVNTACSKQPNVVPCWIPHSRMMTLGIKFMFIVLMVQTMLTFCELCMELGKLCFGDNKGFSRDYNEADFHQESKKITVVYPHLTPQNSLDPFIEMEPTNPNPVAFRSSAPTLSLESRKKE